MCLVPWDLSMNVMRSALTHIDENVTKQFIDEYLLKVIAMMTSQRFVI
jgi:hypothetical protein